MIDFHEPQAQKENGGDRSLFVIAVVVVLLVIAAFGRAQETDPRLREVLGLMADLNVQLMEIEEWCNKFANHTDPNLLPIARARIISNMDMDMWDVERNRCRTYDEMFSIMFNRIVEDIQ